MFPTQKNQGSKDRKDHWRGWASAVLAVLSAALVAACGGGGSSTDAVTGAAVASKTEVALTENEKAMRDLESQDDDDDDKEDANGKRKDCKERNNKTFRKLLDCVTLDGVRAHQLKLRDIALANNGTRVSGTKGFDDSADYAAKVFRDAGYKVTRQTFQFNTFIEQPGTSLFRTTPAPAASIPVNIMQYSGSVNVTAAVSTPSNIFGCEAADFAGFPAGHIALISRGVCNFAPKAANAHAAGAAAVVIYNDGRPGPLELNGTLFEDFTLDIAVVGIAQAVGQQLALQLATPAGLKLAVKTSTIRASATSSNVIAESREGDASNVVMVGAHLDSVREGPGINDNGSGSAAILEVAVQMGKVKPRNKLRFALWGAEESFNVGSIRYVDSLVQAEKASIALYLNFDMIGSPNHVFFIHDNTFGGTDGIQKTFEAFYNKKGVPFKVIGFDRPSDYFTFALADIPVGGVLTGAAEIKSAAEKELWGGTAGAPYDPCYHQACDNFDNVNLFALDVNSDAVAYSTLQFAMTTEAVNGIKGKKLSPRIEKSLGGTERGTVPK
jgi:Zn-dependent M28 family amino/carboxypeptidase